ncbi:uncharacterized protein LOC109841871 [Asparagus officinalis]|uniref:uncharacterized protein LOC109841871 n=1 Tax=Asparagus officinalis TaxID=4686 RepID=UPI00098E1EE0|nr:uncharacterized protein LOC109841871 [Asparagus officinalis]
MDDDDNIDDEYEELLLAQIEEKGRANQSSRGGHRGSLMGHRIVNRDLIEGHERLCRDYFDNPPKYGARLFRRRFRMKQALFMRIHEAVVAHDTYFVQKRNSAGRLGLSSLQKVTAAFRQLAYSVLADYVDEYVQIGESTAIESLKKFVTAVVEVFGDEYLRSPNSDDLKRLLAIGERRGFPGMLGSIDCMHWTWKNCPTSWHGMFTGHIHEPTIILEVVASYDLWIWHAFFGLPGSLNDINVLERSYVFSGLDEGSVPHISYKVNGRPYDMGYYLADGIYPSWATLVKTIPAPQGNKHRHFAKEQEGARKGVEHAFGVLQSRFAIVRNPARLWDKDNLKHIMMACIIMHNMIVEDERDEHECIRKLRKIHDIEEEYDHVDEIPRISLSLERTPIIIEFIANRHRVRDKQMHTQLQEDLVEHLWKKHGAN